MSLTNGETMAARLGRNSLSERERQRIKELLSKGLPVAEISKIFNCSLNPIRKIKKEMNESLS